MRLRFPAEMPRTALCKGGLAPCGFCRAQVLSWGSLSPLLGELSRSRAAASSLHTLITWHRWGFYSKSWDSAARPPAALSREEAILGRGLCGQPLPPCPTKPSLHKKRPRAKTKRSRSPSWLCHSSPLPPHCPLSALPPKAKPPSPAPQDLHESSQWGVLFIHAGLILLNYKVCQMRI